MRGDGDMRTAQLALNAICTMNQSIAKHTGSTGQSSETTGSKQTASKRGFDMRDKAFYALEEDECAECGNKLDENDICTWCGHHRNR